MPERDDDCFRQPFANEPRQQREMVVLDQDDRTVGLDLLEYRIGELSVDRPVGLPVACPKHRTRESDMAQRPQAFVGGAEVMALVLFLAQPHAPQRIGRVIRRNRDAVVGIDRLPIGGSAAMRNPDAATGAQDRLERRDQAARRRFQFNGAVLGLVSVRFPIGYDDDFGIEQLVVQKRAQPFGRPVHDRMIFRIRRRFRIWWPRRNIFGFRHARRSGSCVEPQARAVSNAKQARADAAQSEKPAQCCGNQFVCHFPVTPFAASKPTSAAWHLK